MQKYELKATKEFLDNFGNLPKDIQFRFEKQFKRLIADLYSLGKPIQGKRWFRELKQKGYRVYYLIWENELKVILPDSSAKNNQNKTIENIYNKFIKNRKEKNKYEEASFNYYG